MKKTAFDIVVLVALSGCSRSKSDLAAFSADAAASTPAETVVARAPAASAEAASTGVNNHAIIDGTRAEDGKEATSDLRKVVPLKQKTPNGAFTVGKAFILRDTKEKKDQTGSNVAIEVTNASAFVQCNVIAIPLTLHDAKGVAVGTAQGAEVQGSMGGPKDGRSTAPSASLGTILQHSCLAPRESGWLLVPVEDAPFEAVSAASLELSATEGVATVPVGRCVPTGYTWAGLGLDVTVANQGKTPLAVEGGAFVALDEHGDPLALGMLNGSASPATLAPGTTATIGTLVPYQGKGARRVLAWVHFKDS